MNHVISALRPAAATPLVLPRITREARSAFLFLRRRIFQFGVSPRERFSLEKNPSFVAALDESFEGAGTRKSGRDCCPIAVFQMTRS